MQPLGPRANISVVAPSRPPSARKDVVRQSRVQHRKALKKVNTEKLRLPFGAHTCAVDTSEQQTSVSTCRSTPTHRSRLSDAAPRGRRHQDVDRKATQRFASEYRKSDRHAPTKRTNIPHNAKAPKRKTEPKRHSRRHQTRPHNHPASIHPPQQCIDRDVHLVRAGRGHGRAASASEVKPTSTASAAQTPLDQRHQGRVASVQSTPPQSEAM